MPRRDWSRRDILRECLAAGILIVPARWGEAETLHAWVDGQAQTAADGARRDGAVLQEARTEHDNDCGQAAIQGCRSPSRVACINVHGEPVPGAMVEVWQANHGGLYDLEGYRYRAAIKPPASGAYAFESVMPGHYPARVARHVHYFVTAPGHKALTTQLYFATDEVFDGNPDRNFSKDPLITSRTLVRPVRLHGQPDAPAASVEFELVLEKA